MCNIEQNLVLAFGYDVAAIPVAAGLLYLVTGALLSPMTAEAAMAISSISVVLDSARLNRFRPRPIDLDPYPAGAPRAAPAPATTSSEH